MFSAKQKHRYLSRDYLWLWLALAFQAGFANAGGFLACARFVSHMTGFGTQVGISLSRAELWLAFEMFTAPAAFVLGAMCSAMLVDRRVIRKQSPRYLTVLFLIFLTFLAVTLGGIGGKFGEFGEPLVLARDFELLALLCFACGMQNACFTSLTFGQIRTTHLTGIATDAGIGFVKLFYLKPQHRDTKLLKRINSIRMLTFLSFSTGSASAAVFFAKMQYHGFALLAFSSLLIYLVLAFHQHRQNKGRKNRSLPLDGRRRFARDVVDDSVDAPNLIANSR